MVGTELADLGVVALLLIAVLCLGQCLREDFRPYLRWLVWNLLAIAIGTVLTTYFYAQFLQNHRYDSIRNAFMNYLLYFGRQTHDELNSVLNAAFAASMATCLATHMVCYEKWKFNVLATLIFGTSCGANAGIATGIVDVLTALGVALVSCIVTTASLLILQRILHLFVNWITGMVKRKVTSYIYEVIWSLPGRTLESVTSTMYSWASYFQETQEEPRDERIPFKVAGIAVTVAAVLGFLFGSNVTNVPFLDIKLGLNDCKLSLSMSFVTAVVTVLAMEIPLVSEWKPINVFVGVLTGISLGTNVGMVTGQSQIETVLLITAFTSLASVFLILLTTMFWRRWKDEQTKDHYD